MGRACSICGREEQCIQALVGEPEGKRALGSSRCRWESNIKRDLREIGWGGIGVINQAQRKDQWPALVNTVMDLRVP
jgi:hypothetical protein